MWDSGDRDESRQAGDSGTLGEGKHMIGWGLALLVAGWLLIFLAVVRVLPMSFALGFAAYAVSVAGFVLGLYGVMLHRSRG